MPIFSAEDRDFWQRNGYIVVHNAVPSDNIESAKGAIWDFLSMELDVSLLFDTITIVSLLARTT